MNQSESKGQAGFWKPGGTIPEAVQALADAREAFTADRNEDAARAVQAAARFLRGAGWAPAARFSDALLPLLAPGGDGEASRALADAALRDFGEALTRQSLYQLPRSTALMRLYAALEQAARSGPGRPDGAGSGAPGCVDGFTLAGRPVPPATLRPPSAPAMLNGIRAEFEGALLSIFRAAAGTGTALASNHDGFCQGGDAVLDEAYARLIACMGKAGGSGPYDFWRLAAVCAVAARAAHGEHGVAAKRVLARCNLLLREQARGMALAPAPLVRAALALVWCADAAGVHAPDMAELMLDYGLSPRPEPDRESLDTALSAGVTDAENAVPAGVPSRRIGALRVADEPFEAFLELAEASTAALLEHAGAARRTHGEAAARAARDAAAAAYRIGTGASVLGLGGVAMQADALGLAWRRHAHRCTGSSPRAAPPTAALEAGADSLRRMLHQIAAGVAPASASAAIAALAALIETPDAATTESTRN